MQRVSRNSHFAFLAAIGAMLVVAAACAGSADQSEMAPPDSAVVQADRDTSPDEFSYTGQEQISPAGDDGAEAGAPGQANGTIAGTGGGESAPGTLPALLDRKIILTATLSIETDAVSQRFEDVGNIAAANGGFVASSSFGTEDIIGDDGEEQARQTASLTIRIPSENYQRAVVELRKLGEVKDVDTGSSDVTEEFTDLESRLRGLRAVEQQYMDFLARAVTIDEVLTVQDRLNGVRVEMEQVQGRINLIGNQTDLATITVHLAPPIAAKVEPKVENGSVTPLEAMENGWEASLEVLTGIAAVVLAVLAFSWWLIPVALVAFWALRRFLRASDARIAPPAPPAAPTV